MASVWAVSRLIGRLGVPAPPGPDRHPPRVSGWVSLGVAGWLAGQVVGALVFTLSGPLFLVTGVASGVAAGGTLQDEILAVSAGAPLVALAVWQIPVWATELAAVALGVAGRGRRWRDDLGLRFSALDPVVGLACGLGAQVAIGAAYALFGIDAEGPARSLISKGSGWAGLVGLFLLLAVAAPVVEELLFRGLLLRGLAGRLPGWAALMVSSAVFAAVHFQPVQFVGLFVAGLTFGGLALLYDRLGPAIMAHMVFNASTVLYLAKR